MLSVPALPEQSGAVQSLVTCSVVLRCRHGSRSFYTRQILIPYNRDRPIPYKQHERIEDHQSLNFSHTRNLGMEDDIICSTLREASTPASLQRENYNGMTTRAR